MRILFLSQRVPYPPNRGDKITTWRLIERMAREHEVRIVAFAHDEQDLEAAQTLRDKGFPTTAVPLRPLWARIRSLPLFLTGRPLTLGVFGSSEVQAQVDREIQSADLAYAYSSSMGAFFLSHSNTPRIMHFAELDSDKWRQYVGRTRPPMKWVYARECKTLFRFEQELAHAVDENVFCTPLEEEIFRRWIPGAASSVLRNGVDLESHRPSPEQAEKGHLAFVGVMNYYPNVDGCIWFANRILPRIRERHPEAHLTIVGSHPTPEVVKLGSLPGVEVTGFVNDPKDYLRRAAVSVAPLRIARGIQNKVLEAMAMGLPVVGTTSATQGVAAQAGRDYLVEDEEDGQVEAICGLLAAPERARELGRAARTFVEENYDWEVTLRPLDRMLEKHGKKATTKP